MQLIVIVLYYLVGLSGSEYILGKKRAWLLLLGYYNEVGFANRKKSDFRSLSWATSAKL